MPQAMRQWIRGFSQHLFGKSVHSPAVAPTPTPIELSAKQIRIRNIGGLLRNRGWISASDQMTVAMGVDPLKNEPALPLLHRVDKGPDQLIGVVSDCVVSTLHFRELDAMDEARIAFKHGVRVIDMEIFSQCNRRCHYCSNSVMDRFTWNQFMDVELYRSILADLKSIDWDGSFRFIGLNEPLLHQDFFLARVREAREALPNALLTVYTNGDYLDAEYLGQIYDAGLRAMYISVHLLQGEAFSDKKILKRMHALAEKLSTPLTIQTHIPGRTISGSMAYRDMSIQIFQHDYEHVGHDRGGILQGIGPQDIVRTAACTTPIQMMVISHNGNVLPCCHFVGDAEQHKHLVVGKLGGENSIFAVYGSQAYLAWRRDLFSVGPKGKECRNCVDYADSPMHNSRAFTDNSVKITHGTAIEEPLYECVANGEVVEGVIVIPSGSPHNS